MIPDRDYAWQLLKRYNESDALIKHALSVEAVMRHFAEIYNEDPDKWGVVGLLHDLDYEKYPEEHCRKSEEILKEEGIDEEYVRAVISHGYGICMDVEPISNLEKVLYATDELTGLITAAAIMRPSKSVLDLELKSVKKKYKQSSFAAGVNRAVIEKGAEMLGVELDYLITESILGMRKAAEAVGLKGAL